jgi:protein involved in polysaccharide export with SLBB domain
MQFMRAFSRSFCVALIVIAVALAWIDDVDAQQSPAAPSLAPNAQKTLTDNSYKLGPGDKLRVIVFGEDDLTGEFQIDGSGFIRLPLIEQVQAAGLSVLQFADEVKRKLDSGYLRDARVSVEVINYRPFYIIGEVNKPGEYPYVSGMSVLNAVAVAGGYTYRANNSNVYIRRNGTSQEMSAPADQTTKINPGDIIRVRERFF